MALGPGRRASARGDFSAAFVFGEVEAGGEGTWASALRQLRGKVRPGGRSQGCSARSHIVMCSSGLLLQLLSFVFLSRDQPRRWTRRLRK